MAKHATKSQIECEHDFETFKETVRADTDFAYTAHFVVKGCVKCHFKMRVDYKIL